jgi:hypothetical protein
MSGVPKGILTPLQKRERIARRTCAALGYNECVTYSFIDQASAALFGGGGDAAMLENPISSEMSHMRPDLLPGLLQAAARNQARGIHGSRAVRGRPRLPRWRAGRGASSGSGAFSSATPARGPAWRAPCRRCLRRQGGCRGGAVGHRRAREGADPARRARLVAPGSARPDLPWAEEGAGHLRRAASEGPARDGREGPGHGLHASSPRKCRPAAARSRGPRWGQQPAAGGTGLRLRGRCRCRGADAGQCRGRCRQGADRRCARLRRVHRRQPRRGQEIPCHHGAAAAHRKDPDRRRDRGRGREDRREGEKATGGVLRG